MKIYIGADHAGYRLKEKLKEFLKEKNYTIEDKGAFELNPDDDYPDFVRPVTKAVASDPEASRGVVIGGSGQGEAVVANRQKGVRAVVFYGPHSPITNADINGRKSDDLFEIVKLARMHNNANILSIGARFVTEEEAGKAVEIFLATEFEGARHAARLEKIDN
ncbi:hypothetical protein A2Z53_03025 [Candidatus Giovannonibacteria bacterium RIFCSPHIGHO2_02_42_15]|uniref:Ribose-5-phosphate isomerase n=2 Tax=Candidatus Giovannoniibacteriota TaxID=1752738 RepID=A0A1F5VNC7_9BACT|nr:MAG: Ribose 5-phosphate isomerase rpib [Candidatus Giovannonibacteria bacterium GW2011_GWF2_42_19]OGF64915.1 MAG: hypothetical protein A2Z53_03025 [Candidatus Giovannonibacteria bacterium RIFCSPHIGHO2_02_42_15]